MKTESRINSLLSFARRLQVATTFDQLLTEAQAEVARATGYQHAWLMVSMESKPDHLRLLSVSGNQQQRVWDVAPTLNVAGDALVAELMAEDHPVVIEDARLDPRTNKAMVDQLQNRTLINIPLRPLDESFGVFGVGTFGDEGCRLPTGKQLEYLVGMAGQIAVAAGRLRLLETKADAERQRHKTTQRLAQIQKLESLGLLAGGIAHDFNNMLTVIIASITLAERNSEQPEVRFELNAALEAAGRIKSLTGQLLAIGRTQPLAIRPVNINEHLRNFVTMLQRLLPSSIRTDLITGVDLPTADADPAQLDQILLNLALNARDAMPDGGRLTFETEQVLVNGHYVETHPWAKSGRYVLLTVTDTGTGMPREVCDRIFEPFFSTKGSTAGSGLGLAVVHGVVQQHGGMVHCYSEVGVGTTFKVYLPARERLAGSVGNKLGSTVRGGTERILIAEDDDLVRAVAVRILKRAGYDVLAVESGVAACEVVESQDFDLVLLDVITPGLPCEQVVQRLRLERPELKVLLASGYTAGENVNRLLEVTGLELMQKPYDPDTLLRTVRRALDHDVAPKETRER